MRTDVMVGSCYIIWVSFRGRTDRGGGAPAIIFGVFVRKSRRRGFRICRFSRVSMFVMV